jgi:uncharacterized protein (DUF1015 family)
MAAIVPAMDPGLVVRPIHRIVPREAPADWVERLHENFAIEEVKPAGEESVEAEALQTRLADEPSGIVAVNLKPGMVHILTPRDERVFERIAPSGHTGDWVRVGPNLLRYGVLGPLWDISDEELRQGAIEFDHDVSTAYSKALGAPETTAFLLNAVTVRQVIDLADAGERLPQKSTFFHPKLGTGLVMSPLYR